jgi:hypothetical protein
MNHRDKTGNIVKDDHIKRVKKLLNKKKVIFQSNIWGKDMEFEVTNIRKYKVRWSFSKKTYCYEVDIKYKYNNTYINKYFMGEKRKLNRRIRNGQTENVLLDELVFFGIDNVCVSKISYE